MSETMATDSLPDPEGSSVQLAAWNSFVAGMTQWCQANLPEGYIADDSRESIYEGCGE